MRTVPDARDERATEINIELTSVRYKEIMTKLRLHYTELIKPNTNSNIIQIHQVEIRLYGVKDK